MVTDMHVRSALNWVTRLAGLKYAVWGRVVFVSNSDRIAQGLPIIPPSLGKRTRRKLDQRVSFDFVDTPVSDVARFLKELTGVDVRADPRSDPEKINVTLKLADIPLAEAIAWVALVADMQIKTKGWSTLVLARKAQAGAGAQR
jgi:type II secretory pathway component HofQ